MSHRNMRETDPAPKMTDGPSQRDIKTDPETFFLDNAHGGKYWCVRAFIDTSSPPMLDVTFVQPFRPFASHFPGFFPKHRFYI